MKKLVIGILAHVDSGKTTLSEAILYTCGAIRKAGRVDHKDAFLDTYAMEKSRGITIFSKQAVFETENTAFTLLDTPGHVDFSAETERAISVLDYAVLVISGTDGIQSHTETIWSLLTKYKIPTFIFVNKMDQPGTDKSKVLSELISVLGDGCIDFSASISREDFSENLSLTDESIMEEYITKGNISNSLIANSIRSRKIYPCIFGSALKFSGIEDFLAVLDKYTLQIDDKKVFGGRIYKITEDSQGVRLTHIKITGGSLKVKDIVTDGEKVNQIRIYSGSKFSAVSEVRCGEVCAVTGLTKTFAGEGLGFETKNTSNILEPVLTYKIILPPDLDEQRTMGFLRKLSEEDPQLNLVWNKQLHEIHLQLMGEVQLEILKELILERFGFSVDFTDESILYKETILEPVEGVGHYEPLRHYAEVHLLLEPGKFGSGITVETDCREDELDRNFQRLILTHLQEKTHIGVLTGSPITDIKITLLTGRAHIKHTEGGDFRQATYRAVRQGLKSAKSILLEPYYNFKLKLPTEHVGRAINDIQNMFGEFEPPESLGDITVLRGTAPVACMGGYHRDITVYTGGKGRLSCTFCGYKPCHNSDEVIAAINYDSDSDLENSCDSVFCSHGSGFLVKWDMVPKYMHLETPYSKPPQKEPEPQIKAQAKRYCADLVDDKELMAIFEKTYGPIRRDPRIAFKSAKTAENNSSYKRKWVAPGENYLLVDGYNIIFAWDELKKAAQDNLDAARNELINRLCNYCGFSKCNLILVFDAYKVKGNSGSVERIHNIDVVYTKEAETADMYIEKVTHKLSRHNNVRVATSDGTEQMIILGHGALRVSATDFHKEVETAEKAIREYLQ